MCASAKHAAPRGNFLLDRKDKQAVFSAPPIGEAGSFLPGGPCFLDRKDKQAGLARLFIVFSPTGKTSELPWDPGHPYFLLDRKDKQASFPGTRGRCAVFFLRKDKQAFIHRLFNDLGPRLFKLGPRTLVKGQKSRCF